MIETQQISQPATVIKALVCDCCGKRVEADDVMQMQETHQFRFTGGYGSVFGDGSSFACDLCDDCCLKLFKPYMREVFPGQPEGAEA